MKLIIYTDGDFSVGEFPCSFEIDCPFEHDDVEPKIEEEFKETMLNIYKDWCDYKLHAQYDYELYKKYLLPIIEETKPKEINYKDGFEDLYDF